MLPGDGFKSQRNLQGCYLSSPVSLWKGKLSDTSHLSFLWAQGCQVTVARDRFNCSSYYKELKLTECCLYTGKPCLRGQFPYKKAHPDKAQDIVQRHRPQSWSWHMDGQKSLPGQQKVPCCLGLLESLWLPLWEGKGALFKGHRLFKGHWQTQKAWDPCKEDGGN